MEINKKQENVICVFEEEGKTLEERIIEAFELYLKSNLLIDKN